MVPMESTNVPDGNNTLTLSVIYISVGMTSCDNILWDHICPRKKSHAKKVSAWLLQAFQGSPSLCGGGEGETPKPE